MIRFTQYLRPDGRKAPGDIERPKEIEKVAHAFIEKGGRFECEHLTTGHVSLTAAFPVDGEDKDIAIQLCPNGPAVPQVVDLLVVEAAKWYLETHGKDTTKS